MIFRARGDLTPLHPVGEVEQRRHCSRPHDSIEGSHASLRHRLGIHELLTRGRTAPAGRASASDWTLDRHDVEVGYLRMQAHRGIIARVDDERTGRGSSRSRRASVANIAVYAAPGVAAGNGGLASTVARVSGVARSRLASYAARTKARRCPTGVDECLRVDTGTWSKAPAGSLSASASTRSGRAPPRRAPPWRRSCDPPARSATARRVGHLSTSSTKSRARLGEGCGR